MLLLAEAIWLPPLFLAWFPLGDNPACIHVADKNFEKLENLHKEFNVTTHQETGEWLSEMDCVVLAVKPQQLPEVLIQNKEFLKDTFVLSIAAGVKTKDIEKLLGQNRICRVMPNTPVREGLGVCGIFMVSKEEKDKETVEAILKPTGLLIWCTTESMIDSLTAVSGSRSCLCFPFLSCIGESCIGIRFHCARSSRHGGLYHPWFFNVST